MKTKMKINYSKFSTSQLEELLKGVESQIDIRVYLNPKYDGYQMEQIRLGLEEGLDVSLYADEKYDDNQAIKTNKRENIIQIKQYVKKYKAR